MVAVIASKGGCGGPAPKVIAYDDHGNKLWEHEDVWDAEFSPKGDFIVGRSKSGHGLTLLDASGAAVWQQPTIFGRLIFSKDEKSAIALGGPAIYMLDTKDGKILWKWEHPWNKVKAPDGPGPKWNMVERNEPDFGVSNVAATSDLHFIAAIGTSWGWKYQLAGSPQGSVSPLEDHILVLNGSGKLLAEKILPEGTFPILTTPTPISISDDGKDIGVQGTSGILNFKFELKK
jgi:hypothetical protein